MQKTTLFEYNHEEDIRKKLLEHKLSGQHPTIGRRLPEEMFKHKNVISENLKEPHLQ